MAPTHPLLQRRLAGVLAHPSSLPSRRPIGDLGPSSHRFVDRLANAGFGLWQMLPVNPVGPGDSPYSSPSSFAGEPLLVSLDDLVARGWLPRTTLRSATDCRERTRVDYDAARRFALPRLRAAFDGFRSKRGERTASWRGFLVEARSWLDAWTDHVAEREAARTQRAPRDEDRAFAAFVQYAFDLQWRALRAHASSRGVRLVGDLPIFVPADSVDVRANPELFRIDRSGRPTVLTGVPADGYAVDGQLWGHPHYRWAAHRRDGFAWWIARVRAQLERFDVVRIDHFIGLRRAWEVPGDATIARHGCWKRTPGEELLQAFVDTFGPLPFIAEDLGDTGPDVVALRDGFSLPGMRILQWAFFSETSGDLPHNHPRRSVVYPGTHDNDTARGWWRTLPAEARRRALAYTGGASNDPASLLARAALTSPANWAIIPLQDLLGLGSSARMNVPGTPVGNWRWRAKASQISGWRAPSWRSLVHASGRRVRPEEPGHA